MKNEKKFCKPAAPLDNDIKMPQKKFCNTCPGRLCGGDEGNDTFCRQKPKTKTKKNLKN
jgi:hypothetical protein